MKEESKFKVGDITNKGTVDKIYSFKDISINGELYDLSKHNIKLLKECQTQEPVKIFIADFAMKVLREKYSLDKEEFELMLRRKHGNFWNDYYRENEEKYISSLKQYPATWLTPEMDGKELTEGKDFELYDNADYTAGYSASQKVKNANELFRDDFQAYADRILRDKGASNKDVFDAINDTMQELSKKYNITIAASLPQSSIEEDESGFDKELLMMASWIDKIGVDNTAITRGAAKIKIGSALKRMLEYNSSSSVTGEESWKEVIINRISEFQKIYHANEAGRLTLALKAIEELIPPSYFESLPVTGESEAIGMIKWIRENYEPEFGDGRHWEDILDEAETPISDKELYNLYKQSKK